VVIRESLYPQHFEGDSSLKRPRARGKLFCGLSKIRSRRADQYNMICSISWTDSVFSGVFFCSDVCDQAKFSHERLIIQRPWEPIKLSRIFVVEEMSDRRNWVCDSVKAARLKMGITLHEVGLAPLFRSQFRLLHGEPEARLFQSRLVVLNRIQSKTRVRPWHRP